MIRELIAAKEAEFDTQLADRQKAREQFKLEGVEALERELPQLLRKGCGRRSGRSWMAGIFRPGKVGGFRGSSMGRRWSWRAS